MRNALYAGTFDPLTFGHLWMITTGVKLFDVLTVVVATNPDKTPLYSLEERMEIIRSVKRRFHIADTPTISLPEDRLLVDLAEERGAQFILRGMRNASDFEYERSMRHVNRDINPRIQTVFLMPPREIAEVSSSMVKNLAKSGNVELVSKYAPPESFTRLFNLDRTKE